MNHGEDHPILNFSRKEKNGIMLLMLINIAVAFFPRVYDRIFHDPLPDQSIILKANAKLISAVIDSSEHEEHQQQGFLKTSNTEKETGHRRFFFDPNTINDQQWRDLGVNEKTIHTIQNYLSKGGHFNTPEDIKKIWGLSPTLSNQLIPWVQMLSVNKISNTIIRQSSQHVLRETQKIIDINIADSALFESLPGIGPALSRRIVLFRNKLGGFYTISQIAEVWGVQDTVFQKIKNRLDINKIDIKKMNINSASVEQLKSHPYIGYKIALFIENYRKQHGYFKSLDEIQQFPLIDEKTYNKILHYLVVEQ